MRECACVNIVHYFCISAMGSIQPIFAKHWIYSMYGCVCVCVCLHEGAEKKTLDQRLSANSKNMFFAQFFPNSLSFSAFLE